MTDDHTATEGGDEDFADGLGYPWKRTLSGEFAPVDQRCDATTNEGRVCRGRRVGEHGICEDEDDHHGIASTEPWVESPDDHTATEGGEAWNVVAAVRDRYPRVPDDAPSEEIVSALAAAGLLATAGTGGEAEDTAALAAGGEES